jgi:hypothetical protein
VVEIGGVLEVGVGDAGALEVGTVVVIDAAGGVLLTLSDLVSSSMLPCPAQADRQRISTLE